MKQILTTLLLLFSLTISAQTVDVVGPKKKQQTTAPAKPKPVTPAAKPQSKQQPTTVTKPNESGKHKASKPVVSKTKEQPEKKPTTYTLPSTISNYSKASDYYQKALNDDVAAMCELGKLYLKGKDGAKKDGDQAFRWLKKAAEAGNANAMAYYGDCFYEGIGTAKNDELSYQWDKKSADLGDPYGLNSLGACYEIGIYVAQDYTRAFQLYKQAAELGNSYGQRNLGKLYIEGKGTQQNIQEGLRWYEKSIAQNNPMALYDMGMCYLYGNEGIGVAMDQRKAFDYFTKVSNQNYAEATCQIGVCYLYGYGVSQDFKKAEMYLNQSIREGSVDGKIWMAKCCLWGSFGKADLTKAYNLLCETSEDGDSQFYLAWYYMHGINGVSKNQNQAFAYYKRSAEAGYMSSMNQLGVCYEKGYGCKSDLQEAYNCYEKAANSGYIKAMVNLGRFYNGKLLYAGKDGLHPANLFLMNIHNDAKAYQLMKTAAEADNKFGMFYLGMCYEHGIGVNKDKSEAKKWYTKVCGRKANNKDALSRTDYMRRQAEGKVYNYSWGDVFDPMQPRKPSLPEFELVP